MTASPAHNTTAAYPPAPWRLTGPAIVAASLVPVARARRCIPRELPVVPLLPGFTLGGLLLASYQAPPATLKYHELIAFAGLVRYEGKRVFWVSQIYVDLEASLRGGRKLWGLPKELADFTWADGPDFSITVRQQGVNLLALTAKTPVVSTTQPIKTAAASLLHGHITASRGYGLGHIGLTHPQIYIPSESPLTQLNLDRPFVAVAGEVDVRYLAG